MLDFQVSLACPESHGGRWGCRDEAVQIFRVVRLYRRFMQHNVLIELMINRPTVFLLLLMCVIVLLASAAIKILEQSHQERFRSFPDVVWFTVVTITTVGCVRRRAGPLWRASKFVKRRWHAGRERLMCFQCAFFQPDRGF